MIKYENECVGCPPERGCLGNACPNINVARYYCDKCGEEIDAYFDIDGEMVCDDCVHDVLAERQKCTIIIY